MNQKQSPQHKKRILSLSLACFFLITSCGDHQQVPNTPDKQSLKVNNTEELEVNKNEKPIANNNEVKGEIQESWILDINSLKNHSQFEDWSTNDKTKSELKKLDIRTVIDIAAAKKDLYSWKEWFKENRPKRMWFFALRASENRKNFHKMYAKYRREITALSSTIDQLSMLQKKDEQQLDKHEQGALLAYKHTALWRADTFIANTKDEFLKLKQKYPEGYKYEKKKKKAKRS